MTATARDMAYSPNPDFNRPIPSSPEAEKAACYAHHKAGGTLGDYFEAYPGDKPWGYGLTAEQRAAAYGQQIGGGGRER